MGPRGGAGLPWRLWPLARMGAEVGQLICEARTTDLPIHPEPPLAPLAPQSHTNALDAPPRMGAGIGAPMAWP